MRGWFEPYFGEFVAVIAQFTAWTAIVLILLLALAWTFRRYSSFGFGSISRGRVPRLAIVDAMALDKRRRLVLIRRDNVEHLILIGGPTDTVIEPAIQRPHARRGGQAAAKGHDARTGVPAAVDPPADDGAGLPTEPAPAMPVVRPTPPPPPQPAVAHTPPAAGADGAQAAMAQDEPLPAAEGDPSPGTAPAQPGVAGSAPGSPMEEAASPPPAFAQPSAEVDPQPSPRPDGEAPNDGIVGPPPGAPPPRPQVPETTPGEESVAESAPANDPEDTDANVGDLEREMTRLLGESDRKPSN